MDASHPGTLCVFDTTFDIPDCLLEVAGDFSPVATFSNTKVARRISVRDMFPRLMEPLLELLRVSIHQNLAGNEPSETDFLELISSTLELSTVTAFRTSNTLICWSPNS